MIQYFKISLLPITKQKYYVIIDYIPYTVDFIPMTHLFYNWKLVLYSLSTMFLLTKSNLSPLAMTFLFSVSMTLCCYIYSFVFTFFRFHIKVKLYSKMWTVFLLLISQVGKLHVLGEIPIRTCRIMYVLLLLCLWQ